MPDGIVHAPRDFGTTSQGELPKIAEMLDADLPKPGIRLTLEFIGERKRYGVILPAIEVGNEASEDALIDAITDLVTTSVRLHIATSKGV